MNSLDSPEKEIAMLIDRAEQLGFTMVDLYHDDDELIAFTLSKSKDYIEAIQNIEIKELISPSARARAISTNLTYIGIWLSPEHLTILINYFDKYKDELKEKGYVNINQWIGSLIISEFILKNKEKGGG